METKNGFLILKSSQISQLFLLHLNTYVMGQWLLWILQYFQCRDRPYTSDSDVYKRQILTFEDGPRAVGIKIIIIPLSTTLQSLLLWMKVSELAIFDVKLAFICPVI